MSAALFLDVRGCAANDNVGASHHHLAMNSVVRRAAKSLGVELSESPFRIQGQLLRPGAYECCRVMLHLASYTDNNDDLLSVLAQLRAQLKQMLEAATRRTNACASKVVLREVASRQRQLVELRLGCSHKTSFENAKK